MYPVSWKQITTNMKKKPVNKSYLVCFPCKTHGKTGFSISFNDFKLSCDIVHHLLVKVRLRFQPMIYCQRKRLRFINYCYY